MNKAKDITSIVERILDQNKEQLIRTISISYFETESFKGDVRDVIKEHVKESIKNKIHGVSDFFFQEFDKYFAKNLNEITTNAIKDRLDNGEEFKQLFQTHMTQYLIELNFEKTMLEFFNSKRELLMEVMLRQMFSDKKSKDE